MEITGNFVETIQVQLKGEYVRLCDLLKLAGVAGSSGQGKHMVAEGEVTVDGKPESRKTAKIRAGQTVECRGARVTVTAKPTTAME
jgi:ribosome-associated protein